MRGRGGRRRRRRGGKKEAVFSLSSFAQQQQIIKASSPLLCTPHLSKKKKSHPFPLSPSPSSPLHISVLRHTVRTVCTNKNRQSTLVPNYVERTISFFIIKKNTITFLMFSNMNGKIIFFSGASCTVFVLFSLLLLLHTHQKRYGADSGSTLFF